MTSSSWLPGHVESLDIPACTTARYDCPVCGAKNTFSVTDDGHQRKWYCFHADCNVKGYTGVTLTKEYAKRAFKSPVKKEPVTPATEAEFVVPDTFVSVGRSLDAELYLRKYGIYDAYLSGSADLRWDFKRGRVVFLIKKDRKVVDAAGRLIHGVGPKWYRYGNSKSPFICGQSVRTAFVVEDCASACAVSGIVTGVALLGTNLLQQHIDSLSKFERVFVALDKDATDKAIDMVRTLSTRVSTKLTVLHTDLKNMVKEERDDFIRSQLNR
jgi:DNA primase